MARLVQRTREKKPVLRWQIIPEFDSRGLLWCELYEHKFLIRITQLKNRYRKGTFLFLFFLDNTKTPSSVCSTNTDIFQFPSCIKMASDFFSIDKLSWTAAWFSLNNRFVTYRDWKIIKTFCSSSSSWVCMQFHIQ